MASKAPAPVVRKTRAAKETTKQADLKTVARIATIPPMQVFHDYVGRMVTKTQSDFDLLDYCDRANMNMLIEGPTGPGKTMFSRAWAAKNNRHFYSVSSNIGIEPSQLFGKYIPDGRGGFVWQDGPVTDLVRHGGLLLINEVNFLPDRVGTVLFGALDGRRQITLLDHKAEVIDGHKDLVIVADMNPEYQGTRPLNDAFRNRFAVQVYWDYDEDVEKQLIHSQSLRNLAGKMRDSFKNGSIETPTSTNMLMEFEQIAQDLDVDTARELFANHYRADEREAVRQAVDTFKGGLVLDYEPPKPAPAPDPMPNDPAADPGSPAHDPGSPTPDSNAPINIDADELDWFQGTMQEE